MIPEKPLIAHVITGLENGGAEATLMRICNADSVYRHHVVSLTDAGRYGAELEVAGTEVTVLGMPKIGIRPIAVLRLWLLLRRLRPVAVQTWMYHADLLGGLVARAAGVRNVAWNIRHSQLDAASVKCRTVFVARACAMLSRRVPTSIVCCAHTAKESHSAFGYDRGRMVVIPNGYELSAYEPDASAIQRFRTGLGLSPDDVLLGMVARVDRNKDHRGLLAALSELRRRDVRFHAVLVGPGMTTETSNVRAMLAEFALNERVSAIGPSSDIATIMSSLNLHVLASRSEGFPNVVAEAMLCATPCVVTNSGDAALIVGDTGWVVPVDDPDALANAIWQAISLRGDKQAWQEQRLAARERIALRFSLSAMLNRYHAVWGQENG